jgi:hypothetical protein
MLEDFEAGEIDAIAAWKLDRLWRVPKELEHIIELVEKTALTVATTDSDIDLNTSQGRVMARVLTAFAQDELDKRSARQKAKFAQDREAGKDHWRGRRPFGLTLEGKLVPDEAQAIQDIAEIILNDGTISAGVTLLINRGIKTTFDKEWQRQPLRRTLMHPRLAGLREHDGELIEGNWEAVLDRDTWEAVVSKLSTPGRAKPKQTEREYLLSGLITCAECGGKAYGIPTRKKLASGTIKHGYVYRCERTHVSKSMVPTDNLVIIKTLEALLSTDYQEVEADKDALKALREARAAELKDWSSWQQEAADEGLRPSEIRSHRERHESRLRELEHKIAELEKVSLVRMPTVEELAEAGPDGEGQIAMVFDWGALSLEKRRRLVSTVWESISIVGTRKGARWDDRTVVLKRRKV